MLFHVKHGDHATLEAVLRWVAKTADRRALERCAQYAELLVSEGIPAGAIGPNEAHRVWSRHVLDSVCFAAGGVGTDWLDVGTGAGLPGIPLACCYPDLELTLLDRSGRRVDLLRRWIRVLELDNVNIVQGDVDTYERRHETLCFRGSLTLDAARITTRRLARNVGVFALSHSGQGTTETPPDDTGLIRVPLRVLDTGVLLLRITP